MITDPSDVTLPDGYTRVPTGKVAVVTTELAMTEPPPARPDPAGDWTLRLVERPDPDWYLDLHGRVGGPWLWWSRPAMVRGRLADILRDPHVEVRTLVVDGRDEAVMELDFRTPQQAELAYFGVSQRLIGSGAGRYLMNRAIERAWAEPGLRRFWVHTCTADHPAAVQFYMRSGFVPVQRYIEIFDDPRIAGHHPDASPHVPVIRADQNR